MLRRSILSLALLAAATPAAVAWDLGLDLELASAYLWRGQVGSDRPALQPSLTLSWGGLAGNLWASVDLSDASDSRWQVVEVDFTLSYGEQTGPLVWEVGAVHFGYPHADWDTHELYLSVGLDLPLRPTLTMSSDVGEARGMYAVASLGHALELGGSAELELSLSAAWGNQRYHDYYFAVPSSAASDGLASAVLWLPVGEHLSLGAALRRSWFFDAEIEAAARELYGHAELTSGGIIVSFTP